MTVLAIGGGGFRSDARYGAVPGPLVEHALSLTAAARAGRPARVCALYTATGDDVARTAQWYATWAARPERASHVALLPMPNVDDVRAHLLAQDAVYLGGGSVAGLSFGPELRPWTDGLALAPGSHCPHYDSEARRRPLYQRLVREGALAPGYAADDGVGLHDEDGALVEAVRDRQGASAWHVTPDGETRVEARRLPEA